MTERPELSRSASGLTRQGAHRVASYMHLAAVVPAALIPGLGLLGAGVAWLFGRRCDRRVDAQGRAAVDFQLTMLLAAAGGYGWLTSALHLPGTAVVPWLLTAYFLSVVLPLFAATATSRGEAWRYPLSLRLLGRGADDG